MKAVFLDRSTIDASINLDAIEVLLESFTTFDLTSPAQVVERAQDAEVIITNKVVINRTLMQQLPRLKLICVAATGTNNIDRDAALEYGVEVKNVVGYSTHSVTQYVFSFLLNYFSQVDRYLSLNQTKPWHQSSTFCQIDFPIQELNQLKLGILGYGNLGRSVGNIAQGFGMTVLVAERPGATQIRDGRVSFETMLTQADVISVHCPLTDENTGLFNQQVFSQMKKGVVFINSARGPIVNSEALAKALKSGQVGYAIIDVLEQEPPKSDHPLLDKTITNIALTHHIAWGSLQAQQQLIAGIAKNIQQFKS